MNYCKNCGQQLRDTDKFCPACGAQVDMDDSLVPDPESLAPNDYEGPRVRLCEDGKYRWKYEMNLITNPTIFLTVFKVFGGIVIGMFLVFDFFFLIDGDWKGLWGMTKAGGLVLAIFFGLTILGVLILAAINKGKYIVLFEMDEEGIAHIVAPEQMKKAQKLGKITALAGAARGSFTTAGAGMLAASRDRSTSVFSRVRKIKSRRWLHVIKVNQLLYKNQVYVPDEDFDFVYDYIKSRCPKAKAK